MLTQNPFTTISLYSIFFFYSQTAVKVETNSCRHALRKNNEEKNQNQKCIPYDYNRVVLEKLDGTPDSDYINASYVDVSINRPIWHSTIEWCPAITQLNDNI